MSRFKKNLMANFGGTVWSSLMHIVFVPLYIKFMGVESYGLIGIYATLQTVFVILDMGISTTLNREMARLSALQGKEQEMRNLLKSLEVIYWPVTAFMGFIIVAIAPFIAHQWVKASLLSTQTIEHTIRIMGFAMALQWPASLYSGGLMGLQRQVLLNVINITANTLRGAGAVLVLWLISPTIQAFFLWQIIISIINTLFLAFFLRYHLPHTGERACFQKELFTGIWKFASSMSGIALTGLFITQLDKIILSKLLPLEEFGYYSFAALMAYGLNRLAWPFYSAVFPRFSELVSLQDELELILLYHRSCQLLAVLILPLASVLIFFSSEILWFWTGDPATVSNTYLLVAFLTIGAGLNGLLNIPGALILSYGWTNLTLSVHIIAIVVLAPLIFYLTSKYGVIGAPISWIIYNLCNMFITTHIMHSRLLKKEKWQWYLNDVGKPLAVSIFVAFLWRTFTPIYTNRISILFLISGVVLTSFSATALSTPYSRSWVMHILNNRTVITQLRIISRWKK